MVKGRDDFVIALRSTFFKKKEKQKFSLISLIILSIILYPYLYLYLIPKTSYFFKNEQPKNIILEDYGPTHVAVTQEKTNQQ
mgnify:CR=1 FL=1